MPAGRLLQRVAGACDGRGALARAQRPFARRLGTHRCALADDRACDQRALMLVEVAVGVIASSLAVLSDAAHMPTDAGTIGLALFATRLARRRPKGAVTDGLGRADIRSAPANDLTLVILACFIVYEGIRRLVNPWLLGWTSLPRDLRRHLNHL